jgi:hypothetical protein
MKHALAHRINFDSYSLQNEAIPLILLQVLQLLKGGSKAGIEDLL